VNVGHACSFSLSLGVLVWISNFDPQKAFCTSFFFGKEKEPISGGTILVFFLFGKKKKSIKEPGKPRISIFASF
jgi:hypothetical protein